MNRKIFQRIYQELDPRFLKVLDDLFLKQFESSKTGYNSLKRLPKNPTIPHFKELLEHHLVPSIVQVASTNCIKYALHQLNCSLIIIKMGLTLIAW